MYTAVLALALGADTSGLMEAEEVLFRNRRVVQRNVVVNVNSFAAHGHVAVNRITVFRSFAYTPLYVPTVVAAYPVYPTAVAGYGAYGGCCNSGPMGGGDPRVQVLQEQMAQLHAKIDAMSNRMAVPK